MHQQVFQARTASGSHKLFCESNEKLHPARLDAVTTMKKELLRLERLAAELLRKPAPADAQGSVAISCTDDGQASVVFSFAATAEPLAPPALSAPPVLLVPPALSAPALSSPLADKQALPAQPFPLGPTTMAPDRAAAVASTSTSLPLDCGAEAAAAESGTIIESGSVRTALALAMASQAAEYDRLAATLDFLRAGSADAPTQPAWLKVLVHEQQVLISTIEQPMRVMLSLLRRGKGKTGFRSLAAHASPMQLTKHMCESVTSGSAHVGRASIREVEILLTLLNACVAGTKTMCCHGACPRRERRRK